VRLGQANNTVIEDNENILTGNFSVSGPQPQGSMKDICLQILSLF